MGCCICNTKLHGVSRCFGFFSLFFLTALLEPASISFCYKRVRVYFCFLLLLLLLLLLLNKLFWMLLLFGSWKQNSLSFLKFSRIIKLKLLFYSFKQNLKKNKIRSLTMDIMFPSSCIAMSCKTKFSCCWEMLCTFFSEEWLHSKTNKTGHQASQGVPHCQQSQGKFFFLWRNVPWDSVGRVYDDHSSHETKRGAKCNDDPDVSDKMIPGLEQKEDKVRHL